MSGAIAFKRDRLQNLLTAKIPNLVINGDLEHRLAGNLHISIPGILNSTVVARVRSNTNLNQLQGRWAKLRIVV